MKYFLSFLATFVFYNIIQSQDISADVEMDKFGNLFITELINDLNIDTDTLITNKNVLIHNKYADLIGKSSSKILNFIQYKPKNKAFSYVISYPKKKNNSYIKKESFIFNSSNYLAYKKHDVFAKKTFDIHVKLPKEYILVYPDKRDLENTFYYVPPIIAGKFQEKIVANYKVYYLKNEKLNSSKLESIIHLMDSAINFYSESLGKIKKPKIIFLPFKGSLLGKTIDNAIILNSRMFHYKRLEKRLLVHEIAHLWFGSGGLQFNKREVTEGIAEFMALQFLKQKEETIYLKKQLNYKYYNSEGIYSLKELKKTKRNKQDFSYNYIPLLFQTYQNNNASFYTKLASFFKDNKQKYSVSLDDLSQFLFLNSLPKLSINEELPDFFILEKGSFLVLRGVTETPKDVIVQYIKENNTISYDTLTFSPSNRIYNIQKSGIFKVNIDPNNKTHQFSRLNDFWLKNQKSLFSKNYYFKMDDVNPKVIKMSESVLDYILDKKNELKKDICKSQFTLKNRLDKIKKLLKEEGLDMIIPTGASANYYKRKHVINVKFTYYNRIENKSKFLYLKLFVDNNLNYLERVELIYPHKELI